MKMFPKKFENWNAFCIAGQFLTLLAQYGNRAAFFELENVFDCMCKEPSNAVMIQNLKTFADTIADYSDAHGPFVLKDCCRKYEPPLGPPPTPAPPQSLVALGPRE